MAGTKESSKERALKPKKTVTRRVNPETGKVHFVTNYQGPSEKSRRMSEALKVKWADPEWRANLLAKRAKAPKRGPGQPRWRKYSRPHKMRWEEGRKLWAKARRQSLRTMKKLKEAGVLENLDTSAEEALQNALEVMRSPMNQGTRLQAAKLVLEYTMAKPVAKSEVTVNKAEDWLASVLADAKKRNGEKEAEDTSDEDRAAE